MSLNNYKLKNIAIGKIDICPIYQSVIDIDDIDFIKRHYEATELEAMNFLNPVSVLQHKDGYMLISGLSTFMAYRDSGALHIKARVLPAASQLEKTLCVLHDIMRLIRLLPLSAKKRNRLKDQLYAFIKKNPDAVKAFSLINNELNSFSKILMYYDKPYRSAHFEHKKKNRNKSHSFKLTGRWFQYDADTICFDFDDGKLFGLSAVKNGFTQKIIFEQRPDSSYEAKASYATDQTLFRFKNIIETVFLANIDSSLICFYPTEKHAEEVYIGRNGVSNIQLDIINRDGKRYFLTYKNQVKYLIDGDYSIKSQNSNITYKMKKFHFAVLPLE